MIRRRKATPRKVGVVAQIQQAFSRKSALGTTLGLILGGFVPVGSFVLCHNELPHVQGDWAWRVLAVLIVGGLVFSAKTVWQWSAAAFQDRWKATGFVLLVEGIMVWAHTPWLSYAALGLLVGINGVATGVTLARGK
jgi:hypothetical protein